MMDYCEDGSLFSGERHGRVAVVKFKEDLLKNLTRLDAKERLFSFLDQIEVDQKVRVVLIFGAPRRMDQEECQRFYKTFATGQATLGDLERLNNAVNQFVLKMVQFRKMVIHAGSGRVAPVFFNMGFACDWRIAGDDTVFQNPCVEMGLLPKGGGIFFFERLMGRGATATLLYSGRQICATEALALGLVNRVVPSVRLETEALRVAEGFSQKSVTAILGIKRLLNYPVQALSDFLDHEDEVIRNSLLKSFSAGNRIAS
ncbi:MAG: enoyl-CoA hydratase/isomerase family protein [Desulfobacterium sp.]|nr:enoyl-CoA hydratase/isomerase family protein [Desulfobacterium sp.]